MEFLRVQVDCRGGFHLVTAEGIMLFSNTSEFQKVILAAVRHSNNLVVDLQDVDFIDSGGISELVSAFRKQTERNKPITVLVKEGSQPDYMLNVTGLTEILNVTTDSSVALLVDESSELLCRVYPSDIKKLGDVYKELREVCKNLPCCEHNISSIMTAVWEAITNAIVHGSPHGEQDGIQVRMSYNNNTLHVEITNRYSEFTLPETKPELQPDSERGKGLYLIYSVMDEVWQTKTDEGSTLHMLKHCEQSEEP